MTSIRTIIAAAAAFTITIAGLGPASASAGTVDLATTIDGNLVLEYTGEVDFGDTALIEEWVEMTGISTILINSPGGYAYEGINLNRMARRLGLRTIAGSSFGAWSAAGLFWVGGTGEYEDETAQAGFHYAYVPYNPSIKTDTVNCIMSNCILLSLGSEQATEDLLHLMDTVRARWDWAGFVVFKRDGISLVDVTATPEDEADTDIFETIAETKGPKSRDSSLPSAAPIMEGK